ncbi:hypothetical protein [Kribbella sp. NPDC004536]|uniref:hypothetical protein n=1 Tax=Kribbella sp. NPDC004536 TaxID=3364106 RepID=UPI0036CD7411
MTGLVPQAQASAGQVTEMWGNLSAAIVRDHTTTPETISVKLTINGFVTIDDPQYWVDHGASVDIKCSGRDYYLRNKPRVAFTGTFDKYSANPIVAYPPGGGFAVQTSPTAPLGGAFHFGLYEDEIWCDLYANIPGSTSQAHIQTNHVYGHF